MPRSLGNPATDCIIWYRSPSTGREFPVYTYCADVDFATAGLLALTSIERPEIVRGEYTDREWNSPSNKTVLAIERRLNRRLNRDDLRYPCFFVRPATPHGCGLFFRDLLREEESLEDEQAIPVREVSVPEFLASGGTILDCPGRHRKVVPATTRRKADKKTAKRSPAKRKQSGST